MRNILLEPVELVGKHLGLLKQASPFTSFYSLEAADIDGAPIDFEAYRDKVVMLVNVPVTSEGAEIPYKDMRLLLDTFAALPGQPFALLLLPCDQFPSPLGLLRERVPPWLRLRRTSSDGLDRSDPDVAAADAVRRACAAHGLDSPALRVLARADVNGARASPVWTYLKAAYGDTSDIGWNFGKFVVARDGNVVGRYCPPLRPALLAAAIEKMIITPPLPHQAAAVAAAAAARGKAAGTAPAVAPQPLVAAAT